MEKRKFLFHLLALLVVAIWGVTFISTKVLINSGLAPAQIFAIRFIMAYAGIWLMSALDGTLLFSHSFRDELLFVLLGITGGSLYFLTENSALELSQACNVSFIVCSAPLLTTLFTLAYKKIGGNSSLASGLENVKLGKWLVCGTMMVFIGMALILFSGMKLHVSVVGDLLAFSAAVCWGIYSIFMGQLTKEYGSLFATRKVFFYGLLTIIPFLTMPDLSILARPEVYGNLLFLGIVASLLCFVAWNIVMSEIGNVTSTNYIYLNPFFTLVAAVLILGESMTVASAIGSGLLVTGVIVAGNQK